jgi:L-threonine kinase
VAEILATATLPSTVGEWVQGWVNGRESLVSLVVGWNGSVDLCLLGVGDVLPIASEKTLRAFYTAKKFFSNTYGSKFPENGFINVINPLPTARGLATSTMDVAGTFAACAAYAGVELPPERLFSLCAGIEASDGIMFQGLALVDHINGILLEPLPPPPDMTILVLIPERQLDTADYRKNSERLAVARTLAPEHERAYETLKRGLEEADPAMVASAATISAAAQQKVIPRVEWELLKKAMSLSGALGIAVAHSGTASGLLFAKGNLFGVDLAEEWLKSSSSDIFGEPATIRRTFVSGGGCLAERL